MAIRTRQAQRAEEPFQMAPMIDMVFLLLVFFMCVGSLAQAEKSIEVDLPESKEAQVPDELLGRGSISITEGGQIYIAEEPVSLAQLQAKIALFVATNPRLRIVIRADQKTSYGEIKKVLTACAEAGAYNVIYASYQSR